jgi:hypothetical protein
LILRFAALLALGCVLSLARPEATTPQKKAGPQKKAAHGTTKSAKASGAHAKTAGKHAKAAGKHGKTSQAKAAQTWRSRQLAPTPDRYKEIQSALAKRGYLNGSPTGVWDAQSADALKHFQQDQNLEPTGKLNSLSLIALGLGAKSSGAMAPPGASPAGIAPRPPSLQAPASAPQNVTPESPALKPSAPQSTGTPAGTER